MSVISFDLFNSPYPQNNRSKANLSTMALVIFLTLHTTQASEFLCHENRVSRQITWIQIDRMRERCSKEYLEDSQKMVQKAAYNLEEYNRMGCMNQSSPECRDLLKRNENQQNDLIQKLNETQKLSQISSTLLNLQTLYDENECLLQDCPDIEEHLDQQYFTLLSEVSEGKIKCSQTAFEKKLDRRIATLLEKRLDESSQVIKNPPCRKKQYHR